MSHTTKKAAAALKSQQQKPSTADEVTAGASSPGSLPPVYFWREIDPNLGWLSQWYECDFTDDKGVVYRSAEHYMMYHKALVFDDPETGAEILAADHPRQVKALGRKVRGFDDDKWKQNRERIVQDGTRFKFTRAVSEEGLRLGMTEDAPLVGMSLRGLLLSTGTRELVEASPLDKIWGVGFSPSKAGANRARWGLNLLGKILMQVREEFRKEDGGEEEEKE
ncbi:hypothetical protein OQA88_4109 [Cercophora sp. LCS_1]